MGAFGIDAVNSALVIACSEVWARLQLIGKVFRMLDDQPVNVSKVERAIGAGFEINWTAPVIGRRQEFAFDFVGVAVASKGDAIQFEHFAMDEVIGRFADKKAVGEVWAKKV